MSKTVTKKKSKQKEVDPKFGVSEWDPAELDVRQTRHGTYESRPPLRGGTWRDQIKEEAYKLRQRQREADSPELKAEKAQQTYEEIESLEDSHIVSFPKLDKKLEESIIKMSNEMSRDVDLVTEDRKQRRINMENEYLNQIDLEEAAVDDFFPVLSRVEEIQPDVMTTDSQISSTVDPIEFMDEEALMKLKLKHMRADQCRTRTHKMYKLFLESATDPKKKESLEHMLLATINNLDRKMNKFKGGLDDYDQKEQYILAQSERLQNEQEKALQEQQELQEVLQGLQEKHKVAEEELKALQRENDDSDKKKKEMEDKINKQRKAKIWREQRLEEGRQKLKELERKRKEKGSLKGEEEENKRIREQQDRLLAEKLMEEEKKEREIKDKNLAEQLQKKQRLEKDEQEKLLTEQLLEKERQEEEEMMRIKEEQEQLDREEQIRLEEEREFNLTEEQKRLQRKELERLRKEHLKTLEREKREKEKKQAQGKARKPIEEEQKQEKESLLDALHSVVNGNKPSKPKDLGWDYQKDKEARRVFERKKELQRLREKEKERKSRKGPECRYPKHPGPCPCKLCGKKGHEFKDCPKLKPPKEVSEQTMEFCTECMVPHPPGRCICKLCKTIGHTATECPWLEEAKATTKPPKTDEKDEEPGVLFCLHCRSETHRIEDCAAYKVAQAKRKKVWCERCKQYGHTMADCLDEKHEQRNREIEREILKRKQQLEEIDRKMQQVKRQAEKDIGKPPQDRDTRDYPIGGRKPVTKPRKSDREPEPPPPPREGPPSGPPVGAGGGGEPPEGDDPSDPDDSDSDESDEEESDNTEATEESGFLYDEKGRKIDIGQFYEAIRKRKKRTVKGEDEIPFKVVRGPRGHRGSKGRKGPPGDPGVSQNLDKSVDANVTIDTAGLEKTFREMGESMREVFTSQQIFNRTMKDTLEASTKAQEKQTEALEKLNVSTKQRDHDHMFATIKPYDGKDSKEFDAWIEQIMTACKISGRNPKLVALAKSTGAVTEVILSMKQKVTWVEFVEELRRCFSDSKTRVHAAAIYNEFRRQDDNENLRSYIHKYTRLHREATGKATDEEFDTHNKLHFLSRLRNSTIATKISQSEEFEKFDRYSLKNCIEKALMLESRLQIREMVTIARENLENKEPKVMEMSEEGEEQQEELNILSEDKGPGRFRNPNLANLICYKCGGYGHYGKDCPEVNQAMDQLEDRIVGRIEHSFNAYTPVTLQYMNDMIVKAAKLEVSRRLAKKKL